MFMYFVLGLFLASVTIGLRLAPGSRSREYAVNTALVTALYILIFWGQW